MALMFALLAGLVPLGLHAAVCTPTAATLCVAGDDLVDVWINGTCVATCVGDFPYIASGTATPVKCISIPPGILSPTGSNSIAVRVTDTSPSQSWGTWALDITCAGGGHSYATSSGPFQFYHDGPGTTPPPVLGGLPWYDPAYVPAPAWGAPSAVTGSVFGKQAVDPASGLPLPPMSWNSAGSSTGTDKMYFRQGFSLTPEPTPLPPSFSASYSASTGTCGVQSGAAFDVNVTVCNSGGVFASPVEVDLTLDSRLAFSGPYSSPPGYALSNSGPGVSIVWPAFPGSGCQTATFQVTDYFIATADNCAITHNAASLSASAGAITLAHDLALVLNCCVVPTPTASPTFTATPTALGTFTWTPTLTASPSISPTFSDTATATATPSATPTATITPTFSISPTFSVSPTITETFTPVIYKRLLEPRGVYPNPFEDQVGIGYALSQAAVVSTQVYNVAGEPVWSEQAQVPAGIHIETWSGANGSGSRCASGVYLVRVSAEVGGQKDSFFERVAIAR